jgi:hypothetical protein
MASQYQEAFDTFCREQLAPVTAFPAAGSVYDYFVEPKEGTMVAWEEVSFIFNRVKTTHDSFDVCDVVIAMFRAYDWFVEPKEGTE